MLFDRGGVCGRRDSHHGRGADTPAVVGRSFNPGDASSVPASDGDINTQSRPIALQVALLIPLLTGLAGLFNSYRMVRLPDPVPSGDGEPMVIG
jgi:hypothetical protein